MSDLFEISGPSHPPAAGGPPQQLVVMLHGWGADGNDLIGLAPHWARALPHAEFLSPHGPFPGDMGMGRQWFSLVDRTPTAMLAGLRAVAPAVDAFIDNALAARGLGDDRLALVGFSQGTMLALHLALRRARPCAGVVGYSGTLLGGELPADEIRARPPILLIHGALDEVVPAAALDATRRALEAAGVPVEAHLRPGLGHGIDPEGIALAAGFLQRVLGQAAGAAPTT